ncbi:ribosomal-protein-alanine N-acetyltransferase [Tersicoccus phoenicis]|uniref:Ribosomal-protein-alanine N-acetyltransferase n=1 Tax=Tersicoccus phoenicis TaxID=554083 RepID=A0A1R1L6C9_9MICC|nr:ribosomal protein S18-alanine N-acetyltransferase [Tersicoccus phoenicis]OMH23101.1 ribosomal-protein-alanine N-acetyltransferase [Tersicoccus phoenicis]
MTLGETVTLRAMTAADLDTVHALEQRLFPADAWPAQMFRDELARTDTRRYLVAEIFSPRGARIVGYAGLMCVLPLADVQTIAVEPAHEGRGIGSALLTALIDEAVRRGADDVLLEVRRDNPRAQALYLRFGFEQIHVRPRYYRDGVDALIMRKRLASLDDSDPEPTPRRGTA